MSVYIKTCCLPFFLTNLNLNSFYYKSNTYKKFLDRNAIAKSSVKIDHKKLNFNVRENEGVNLLRKNRKININDHSFREENKSMWVNNQDFNIFQKIGFSKILN